MAHDSLSRKDVDDLLRGALATSSTDILRDESFEVEEARLDDSLVAMKLLSSDLGTNADELTGLARGYDAIRRAAEANSEDVVLSLRLLTVIPPTPDGPEHEVAGNLRAAIGSEDGEERSDPIDPSRVAAARRILTHLPATSFVDEPKDGEAAQHILDAVSAVLPESSHKRWMLSPDAVLRLPAETRNVIDGLGLRPESDSLGAMLTALAPNQALMTTAPGQITPEQSQQSSDYVGDPAQPMPTHSGRLVPVGIGDLLIVKQHTLRYEGGDVAHIENVLAGETLNRETRRLDRTETTFFQETDTTQEQESDQQTTDRFSLNRETSETLKQDMSAKAGMSIDAKYGTFVEAKANADFSLGTSTEASTRQATEFARDVVTRSASRLTVRTLESRTLTMLAEFEERYGHTLSADTHHVSGVYQWVDKVMEAQIYNYGTRLLFDLVLPEPATAYIVQQLEAGEGTVLKPPVPFTVTADGLDATNYLEWAQHYNVTGLTAPPPTWKRFSKAFKDTVAATTDGKTPLATSSTGDIAIEDYYEALYGFWAAAWNAPTTSVSTQQPDGSYTVSEAPGPSAIVMLLGTTEANATNVANGGYIELNHETGTLEASIETYGGITSWVLNLEIFAVLQERGWTAWQLKTHDALTLAYQEAQQKYDDALQEVASAAVSIVGKNPLFNQQVISTELRKQCLTFLTGQQFDGFGALEESAEGYPQPNLARAAEQMRYVQFFEEAIEWEHLAYFLYPYFWGWKPGWRKRMLLDDVDPSFASFLRAGAARVVFPVRPGFEAAITHYLDPLTNGQLWNGATGPVDIHSPMYVQISEEIQAAEDASGSETPVGDSWNVTLPTTLTLLRPDNDLPKWKKIETTVATATGTKTTEEWVPDE
jgi:hypothetical protein